MFNCHRRLKEKYVLFWVSAPRRTLGTLGTLATLSTLGTLDTLGTLGTVVRHSVRSVYSVQSGDSFSEDLYYQKLFSPLFTFIISTFDQ